MPNGEHEYSQYGWAEWKGKVGADLETLKAGQARLFKMIDELSKEMSSIKAKAAALGASVAVIMNLVFLLIQWAKSAPGG